MGLFVNRLSKRTWLLGGGLALGLGMPALALSVSVGPSGIDALRLHEAPYNLTGRKIAIGQVEIGRPSFFGIDKIATEDLPVNVTQVLDMEVVRSQITTSIHMLPM
jgi:hypothetical protein